MDDSTAFLVKHGGDIVQIALMVIGLASVIAKLTPNKKDDRFFSILNLILDAIALNRRSKPE